jgi:hypothetical protein
VSAPMPKRFGYVEADPLLGVASALPYAPIMLQMGDRKVQVSALIDSGSTLNVLPFDVGLKLGAVWDEQIVPVRLGGNMAESEARGLVLTGQIEGFEPVRLAFAWSKSNRAPVILGQTNFFIEFDVRFCRSQMFFEIAPWTRSGE